MSVSPSNILHYKKVHWSGHQVELIENKEGILTVNIIPRNNATFDSSSILHDKDDRVIRISTIRKVIKC